MSNGLGLVLALIFRNLEYVTADIGKAAVLRQQGCPGPSVRFFAGENKGGNDYDFKGHVPSVALYDEFGDPVGYKHVRALWKKPVSMQEGDAMDICTKGIRRKRATYLSLSASGKIDALCLAGITVTSFDGHIDVITGTMATSCGYQGYPSNTAVGEIYPEKCVWLDGDYSGPLPQGLSFHLKDFEPTEARSKQYNNIPRTLCDSEARMHKHHTFKSTAPIRIFDPPLEYVHQNTDKVDLDFERVWDKKYWKYSNEIPHSYTHFMAKYIDTVGTYASRLFFRAPAAPSLAERFAGTVVKSNKTMHSAVETCADENMVGWDFVSMQERIFCDMISRKTYPFCDDIKTPGACFDEEQNMLRSAVPEMNGTLSDGPMLAAAMPLKTYSQVREWY